MEETNEAIQNTDFLLLLSSVALEIRPYQVLKADFLRTPVSNMTDV